MTPANTTPGTAARDPHNPTTTPIQTLRVQDAFRDFRI